MKLQHPRNTTQYGLAGTKFFRRSSSAMLDEWGGNAQNPTKSICKLYKADSGKMLCQVDQSGAEALVLAYIMPDGNFRQLFLNGVKSHVFVALHVFKEEWKKRLPNCKIDDICQLNIRNIKLHPDWKQLDTLIKESDGWPASIRYYYIAKMICHASNYGMMANSFRMNCLEKSEGKVVLSKHQAEFFLNTYHNLFPEIKNYHRRVEFQLRQSRTVYNLQGFPIYFSTAYSDKLLRDAYSAAPQSTVGCITQTAVCDLQSYIESNNKQWDILNDKHDSYLAQAPIAEAQELAAKMREFMEQELTSPRGEKFHMKSAASLGYNWAPWNEKKNPEGLKEI